MLYRAALLTLSVLSLRASLAQPPTWSDTTFDEAVDRRHDWCPYMQAVSNGTLQLRFELRFSAVCTRRRDSVKNGM
jgi:hypothetical protein